MNNIRRTISRSPIKSALTAVNLLAQILPLFRSSFNTSPTVRFLQEKTQATCTLIMFLLFINGFSREISPSTFGSHPTVSEPLTTRITTTEFISRFLFIESLSTLGFIFLPFLNVRELLQSAGRRICPTWITGDVFGCVSCSSEGVVFPRRASPCEHLYCYFCSASKPSPFRCDKCSSIVHSFIE
jgi:hypothetical protein